MFRFIVEVNLLIEHIIVQDQDGQNNNMENSVLNFGNLSKTENSAFKVWIVEWKTGL